MIVPPWAAGVAHTINEAYNTGLHRHLADTCCNNDYYALDFDLARGEPIYPVAGGRVVYAGPSDGSWKTFGNIVFMEHPGGIQSLYAHLDSVAVKTGDALKPDSMLGTAGASGGVPAHLHLALYEDAKFLLTLGGIGPYGGRAVLPEPFSQCEMDGGGPCEHLVAGARLLKLGEATIAATTALARP